MTQKWPIAMMQSFSVFLFLFFFCSDGRLLVKAFDVVANCLERRLLKNAAALITKYLASIHYKVPQLLSHIASVRKGKGKGKGKGIWTTSPFPFLSNAISQNA